ncbi:uncharacterized protein C8Q71DRAFT_856687 [Rhodofomes roseus]|uniref:DUF6532 domain-containing protein n=1 Tax=Rhodofomes roseus TaxID=34475 RepID=A0ABQ8KKT1_9APHY|nr:uncharacterized protein C8Q71DRAFT_856687 [Rhodofomes roseus]KAH9838763.1 hypothetical protein C8Q71DRAFT_856687 [Rhodofomes roseus]
MSSSPRTTRSTARKQDKVQTAKATKSQEKTSVKPPKTKRSSAAGATSDHDKGWSTSQQKQLDELLKCKAAVQREEKEVQRSGTRKRVTPACKKAKKVQESAKGNISDEVQEAVSVTPASSRSKPKPAYRGAAALTEGERAIVQNLDIAQIANKKGQKEPEEHSDKRVVDSNSSAYAGSEDKKRSSWDEDDVMDMGPKNATKGRASQTTQKSRNCVKAGDLPMDMKPLVNMANNCMHNCLALDTAWTTDTTITSSRLVSSNQLVAYALKDARNSVDKDGKRMVTVCTAYKMLRQGTSSKDDNLRKQVNLVVWGTASQLRNEVKRKAKVIVDHAYGLNVVQTNKRTQLALWLLTTHAMKVKGGKCGIPNFVFGDMQVVWDEKGSIDKEKSNVKNDVPFRHPAISEIITQQWFVGHAKTTTPTERFSSVPDNLIALVCNAIEVSLREVATNTPMSFSNKQWDDLMSILEATRQNAPDYYKATKKLLWDSIKTSTESGFKAKVAASEDKGDTFVNWSKLQTVALEDTSTVSGSKAQPEPSSVEASKNGRKRSTAKPSSSTVAHAGPSKAQVVPAITEPYNTLGDVEELEDDD